MTISKAAGQVLPPPTERYTVFRWLYKNLLSTWYDALLTVISLAFAIAAILGGLNWAIKIAKWEVVWANLRLFLVGQYPVEQIMRIWISLFVLSVIVGLCLGIWAKRQKWLSITVLASPLALALLDVRPQSRVSLVVISVLGFAGWLAGQARSTLLKRPTLIAGIFYFFVFIFLVRGISPESAILPAVRSNFWGGLLLTFMLTVVGIVLSFPIGIFLALGRRSKLPLMKWFSIFFIEVVRGVPLITLLFMAQLMLPLFLPSNVTIDRVVRAMVGVTLFSAAYLAENVRGGLQAIPIGQYEAAHALGLSAFHTTFYIILPQALRAVIPILVGQFIALFKDTTLVAIVGLFDLLGIARTVLAQPIFIGKSLEVYTFISLLFFIFSYVMSYFSQRLEVALGVGER